MAEQVKERPILFSGAMVRANLREVNPKTQTRRVIKPQPEPFGVSSYGGTRQGWTWKPDSLCRSWNDDDKDPYRPDPKRMAALALECECPYGEPGDRLWVRETWASPETNLKLPGRVAYNADGEAGAFIGDGGGGYIWLHHGRVLEAAGYQQCFPKDGSRTYGLKKFGGRWRPSIHMPRWASRLTLEITKIRVERVQEISEQDAIAEGTQLPIAYMPKECQRAAWSERQIFQRLWDSINAKRDGGIYAWEKNPWVWVVEYKRLEGTETAPSAR